MSDLIDRQMAIDALGEEPEVWEDDDEYGMGQRSEWCYIKKILENLPSAQPQRKKGKWILSDDRQWKTCSECGAEIDISRGTGVYIGVDAVSEMRFCPSCGVDMRGESE